MKKIAILSNNLQLGGVQKSLINLLREVSGEYDIELYLADDENEYRPYIPADVKVVKMGYPFRLFGISHAKAKKEGFFVWLQSLLLRGITRMLGKKYVIPFMVKNTKWNDKKFDVAISYVHDGGDKSFYGGCNEFVLRRVSADKKITFMHGDFEKCGSDTLYNRKVLMEFDKIVCVSKYCADRMKKVFSEASFKIDYVGNMINFEELNEKANDDPVIYDKNCYNIITVARLSKEKGLTRCMPAMRILLDRGYKFVWHIIGEGAFRKEIESKITEFGLKENVILYGGKVNPYRYLTNADLFMLPSYEEAEGMVIKESLALKLPVLATDTGATRDIVDEKYGIVCENNDEALSESLFKILDDRKIIEDKKKELIESYRPDNQSNLERFINIVEGDIDTRKAE